MVKQRVCSCRCRSDDMPSGSDMIDDRPASRTARVIKHTVSTTSPTCLELSLAVPSSRFMLIQALCQAVSSEAYARGICKDSITISTRYCAARLAICRVKALTGSFSMT
jgi:hypothetical protein